MMINKIVTLACVLSLSLCAFSQEPAKNRPVSLPVSFEANRFFVEPVTTGGTRLHLYTDSGGGLFVTPSTVKELNLKVETKDGREAVQLPPFAKGKSIPGPLENDGLIPIYRDKTPPHTESWGGLLGQDWFAGRTWTWDYIHHRLLWRANGDLPHNPSHTAKLGFKTDESGKREVDFPRIAITVDGRTFDVLFDTGATTYLTTEALKKIGDRGPADRATSFIVEEIFDRWHQQHPDWMFVDKAEDPTGQPMIRVPEIRVAGYTVGPVWFTRRPNQSFHKFMSQFMDKPVEGALGGSGLRYFTVSIDYPNSVAVFQKP